MSTIFRPNEKPKAVKNLGWLLRNWKGIAVMGFNYSRTNSYDGQLWAKWADGTLYLTDYASLTVCWNFLDRSIFRGLPFSLWNCQTDVRTNYLIGDEEWKRINKLTYPCFVEQVIKPKN